MYMNFNYRMNILSTFFEANHNKLMNLVAY